MIRSSPLLALVLAGILNISAQAQLPPAETVTSLPIACFPASVVRKADDLGQVIWRGTVRERSHEGWKVYEMLETRTGWLLLLKSDSQLCIVATGEVHDLPGHRIKP